MPVKSLIVAAAGTLAIVLLLWATSWPLGVPGEWEWDRAFYGRAALLDFALPVLGAVVYVGVIWVMSRRAAAAGLWKTALLLGVLVLFACGWYWTVQSVMPPPMGEERGPFVLYYPRTSGYFSHARRSEETTREFLASYEPLMAERDYLHIGTHPPGLILLYRGLIAFFEQRPAFAAQVEELSASGDLRLVLAELRRQETAPPLNSVDAAVLLAALAITYLAAALTVVPIYLLIVRFSSAETAFWAAAFWPLIPAVAIFLPKSDCLYPLPAMLLAWLWLSGIERGSAVRTMCAGLTAWAGLMLSLAFLPVIAIVGIACLVEWRQRITAVRKPEAQAKDAVASDPRFRFGLHSGALKRMTILTVAGVIGFAVPVLWLWFTFDLNLINVWWWNVSNHSLFYEHNVRTWWKWTLANPIELAISAGFPLVVLSAIGTWRAIRASQPAAFGVAVGVLLIWTALWLSGKNMGEAARLWIILVPWLCVLAGAVAMPRESSGGTANLRSPDTPSRTWLLACLSLQAVACLATATRIDGFAFIDLLR